MANLFIRTYTFVDGTTAYGSQVEAEVGNIVTVLNNLNTAATNWGQVSALHATNVPLIADCSAGTQHIADFKNNSVIKASFSSAGLLTCAGATVSGTADFTGQLKGKGTATNDSAAAGYIGEYVETVFTYPSNFPATATWGDATSISLTAGDWDVTFNLFISDKGITTTDLEMGISTTTGDSTTGLILGSNWLTPCLPVASATQDTGGTIANYRMLLASTTTVYAKILAGYSGTTPTFGCRLSARRMR